jgi:hypothetical protein
VGPNQDQTIQFLASSHTLYARIKSNSISYLLIRLFPNMSLAQCRVRMKPWDSKIPKYPKISQNIPKYPNRIQQGTGSYPTAPAGAQ